MQQLSRACTQHMAFFAALDYIYRARRKCFATNFPFKIGCVYQMNGTNLYKNQNLIFKINILCPEKKKATINIGKKTLIIYWLNSTRRDLFSALKHRCTNNCMFLVLHYTPKYAAYQEKLYCKGNLFLPPEQFKSPKDLADIKMIQFRYPDFQHVFEEV